MHAPATLPKVWTGSDLIFSEPDHCYRLPLSGVAVPSVTQILSAVGISQDFEILSARGTRLADAIERKRAIGHALHHDAHCHDDQDLALETVHPDVLPYLNAWITFRENQYLFPIQRERRLYSPSLGVCGTLDGVFCRDSAKDRLILLDLKTGDVGAARYQTAAYQMLWEEEHPDQQIAERWAVELTPERQVPYRIHPFTDFMDEQAFRAFVTTFQCQAARRKDNL